MGDFNVFSGFKNHLAREKPLSRTRKKLRPCRVLAGVQGPFPSRAQQLKERVLKQRGPAWVPILLWATCQPCDWQGT